MVKFSKNKMRWIDSQGLPPNRTTSPGWSVQPWTKIYSWTSIIQKMKNINLKSKFWNNKFLFLNSDFQFLKHYLLGGLISGPNHLKNEPSVRTTFSIWLYASGILTRYNLSISQLFEVNWGHPLAYFFFFVSKKPKIDFFKNESFFFWANDSLIII